jgi:hypothetical protein
MILSTSCAHSPPPGLQLNAQQDSIRSVIEMTAGVMVTMSQRTAELAGAPPLPAQRAPFVANSPSVLGYEARTFGPTYPPPLGPEHSGNNSSYSSNGGRHSPFLSTIKPNTKALDTNPRSLSLGSGLQASPAARITTPTAPRSASSSQRPTSSLPPAGPARHPP